MFKVINVSCISTHWCLADLRPPFCFYPVNRDFHTQGIFTALSLSAIDPLASLFAIHCERWDPRPQCQQRKGTRTVFLLGIAVDLLTPWFHWSLRFFSFLADIVSCPKQPRGELSLLKNLIYVCCVSNHHTITILIPKTILDLEQSLWAPLCSGRPVCSFSIQINTNKVHTCTQSHSLLITCRDMLSTPTHFETLAWILTLITLLLYCTLSSSIIRTRIPINSFPAAVIYSIVVCFNFTFCSPCCFSTAVLTTAL